MNGTARAARRFRWLQLLCCVALCGCMSTRDELSGLAARPRLDRAVLVTGGAFLASDGAPFGTFSTAGGLVDGAEAAEAIPLADIVDALERGRVFQRIVADDDLARRRRVRRQLDASSTAQDVRGFLQQARDDGFDLLLLVEELQDGAIESQGTNSRWPVTFATWILLGVGMFIPDRTFESTAALRVSLRELEGGEEVSSLLLVPGPIDLALTERGDVLSLLLSVIVPPFWIGDSDVAVNRSIRETSERRMLLSLVRELKSEGLRRRLEERAAASLTLVDDGAGAIVQVRSAEALSVAVLVAEGLDEASAERFSERLLASRSSEDGVFRYAAAVPPGTPSSFQVRVATLRGGVASSTFGASEGR